MPGDGIELHPILRYIKRYIILILTIVGCTGKCLLKRSFGLGLSPRKRAFCRDPERGTF